MSTADASVPPSGDWAGDAPARVGVPDDVELPGLSDIVSSLHVVAVPLRVPFRGVRWREAALFRGPHGWAEFSPFLEYGPQEAANWLAGGIDAAWGPDIPVSRDRIPVNATVPAVPARRVAKVLSAFGPVRTVKVKVAGRGSSLAGDRERVEAVRRALGEDVRIRIDANGGWTVDQATAALEALAGLDLEYAEQPVATLDEMVEVHRRAAGLGVAIAADESIRKPEDPLRVAQLGAADVVVLKAQPLGGLRRALRVAAESGLPAVVSSALDTSVGLALGARLAAALPELPYDCGLGTGALLAADVCDPPLKPQDGTVPVAAPVPDPRLVTGAAASPRRYRWWVERVSDCLEVLRARRG